MSVGFRRIILVLAGILLLAGCNFPLPPNLPRVPGTGTPGMLTGTPGTPGTPKPTGQTNTPGTVPSTGGSGSATNTPAPKANIPLPAQRQPIQFTRNATSAVVTTNLKSGTVQAYQLQANAGQHMYLTIDGDANIMLYDPNQTPFTGTINVPNPTRFTLTTTGSYYVAMQGSGPVTMSVYIPPTDANFTVPAPVPKDLAPIQFQQGATSTNFAVNMTSGVPLGYSIAAQAGQQIQVTTGGNVTVTLLTDNRTMIPTNPAPTHQWIFPIQQNGTYWMILLGTGTVNVTVSIPAANASQTGGQGSAIPLPGSSSRVNFAPGNASVIINTKLTNGQPQAYVVGVQSGQTLYVSTTGSVDVTIYSPAKKALSSGHADFPNRWSVQASQTGDYTFVISGNGQSTLTFYVPPQ